MQMPPSRHPSPAASCRHTRLAESSVAAIDQCSCGMLQLHLGAFTVRLAPCAAEELLLTLGDALSKRTETPQEEALRFPSCAPGPRGQA